MPGVPKSQGCATCRKRKFKCDESKPSCMKCVDSGWSCPGYPSRFKFQDEGPKLKSKLESIEALMPMRGCLRTLQFSSDEILACSFGSTFSLNLPVGKSLAKFGIFIQEVPRHVGVNDACDSSVMAVCLAHNALLTGNKQSLLKSRGHYSRALAGLRQILGQTGRAVAVETLCAAMLLGIYEVLACTNGAVSIQHVGGASRVIKLGGPDLFKAGFARDMFSSLKGMIVIEAIFCRRKCFLGSPLWKDLSMETIQTLFDAFLLIIQDLPNILFSYQQLSSAKPVAASELSTLLLKATNLRHEMLSFREAPSNEELFRASEIESATPLFDSELIYTSNQAAGLSCFHAEMMILINSVIMKLSNFGTVKFQLQNFEFAKLICHSYRYTANYGPIGHQHMSFALRVAYLVVHDQETRNWIVQTINDILSPLRSEDSREVTSGDIEICFDYLQM